MSDASPRINGELIIDWSNVDWLGKAGFDPSQPRDDRGRWAAWGTDYAVDPNYVYHATNVENMLDIAEAGELVPHAPDYGTDQDSWPDGAVEDRSYFGAGGVWPFAPEHGTSVVLRTPRTPDFRQERYTGDLYSVSPIRSDTLEVLTEDGWVSIHDISKAGFDPNQPRDEDGKWTDQGTIIEDPSTKDMLMMDHRGVKLVLVGRDGNLAQAEEHRAVLNEALDKDKLGYLQGLNRLMILREPYAWLGSHYSPPNRPPYVSDEVVIAPGKSTARTAAEKVTAILHEAGHRGQLNVDKQGFAEFRRQKLGRFFGAIDKERHKVDSSELRRAGETFAESYAMFAEGKALPDELQAFWESKVSSLNKAGFDPNQPRDEEGQWTYAGRSPVSMDDLIGEEDVLGPDQREGFPELENETVLAFHGTRQDYVDEIMKNGITVNKARNFNNEILYDGDRGESVFVAGSFARAAQWAWSAGKKNAKGEVAPDNSVVLRLEIPKNIWAKFVPDEFGGSDDRRGVAVIDPSMIKRVWGFTGKPAESSYATDYKWKPVELTAGRASKADTVVRYAVVLVNGKVSKANFDPNQPRDPETGEWTKVPGTQPDYDTTDFRETEEGEIVAFHGTRKKVLDRIMNEGLKFEGVKRSFDGDLYYGDRGESIYVSDSFSKALSWAAGNSWRGPRPGDIVLRLEIPKKVFDAHFISDEESYGGGDRRANIEAPPEWIKKVWGLEPIERNRPGRVSSPYLKPVELVRKQSELDEVITRYVVIPIDGGVADVAKYDPNQPRDWRGRWTKYTDTEAFKRWFGNSVVVDENGKPLVVYHGTQSLTGFSEFNPQGSFGGPNHFGNWFTSDPGYAAMYAGLPGLPDFQGGALSGPIYPVYLKIEKPWVTGDFDRLMGIIRDRGGFDAAQRKYEAWEKELTEAYAPLADYRGQMATPDFIRLFQETNPAPPNPRSRNFKPDFQRVRDYFRGSGYDGIIFRNWTGDRGGDPNRGAQDVYITLYPEQIKSAIGNDGSFDPTNPDITKAGFDPNQARDERGRWTKEGASEIRDYLQMIAGMAGREPNFARFLLDHGQPYKIDAETFIGGTPQECYRNASLAMMDGMGTYVEGYVAIHGVPIQHAWLTDAKGRVMDVTLGKDSVGKVTGYFGVPVKSSFVTKSMRDSGYYGVFSWTNAKLLSTATPDEIVETNPTPTIRNIIEDEVGKVMFGYIDNASLPSEIRDELPPNAQDVYRVGFNNAIAGGSTPEQARAMAWRGVTTGWVYNGSRWVRYAGGVLKAGFDPNQPRDEHGQWTDTGVSEADAGMDPDKEEIPEEELKGSMTRGPSNFRDVVLQPDKTLDEIYADGKEFEPEYIARLQKFADKSGGKLVLPPAEFSEPGTRMKSRKSAERKMNTDGTSPRNVYDYHRATVEYDTVAEARRGMVMFAKERGSDIVRIKDRIVQPTPGGYRDFLVNVRESNGMISELQITSDSILGVKFGEGHRIYETTRNPETPKDVRDRLNRRSEVLFNHAYEEDGDGEWA